MVEYSNADDWVTLFHRLLSALSLPSAGRWKGALVTVKVVEHSNAWTIGRQWFRRLRSILSSPTHAGRWKGALVAIKVVEHSNAAGKVDIIEGARESLLAASVSHPNIIVRMTGPTGRSSPAWLCPAQHHARCSSEPVGSCCHMLCSRAMLTHISVCVCSDGCLLQNQQEIQCAMPAALCITKHMKSQSACV